jgi:hypothetical protein
MTRGRRYDHNFLRFLIIFDEKIGVFLKNQCYDHLFEKISLVRVKNANFLAKIFKKIVTLVPDIYLIIYLNYLICDCSVLR